MFILLERIYLERFYQDFKNKVLIKLLDIKYTNNEFIYIYIFNILNVKVDVYVKTFIKFYSVTIIRII